MVRRGLSRAYLEATVDSILSTPGALEGAVNPRAAATPEGRARKVHASIHPHGNNQPDCPAIGQIAEAIREAVEAEHKRNREFLDRASEFYFQGPETDLVVALRFNNRDEGSEVRWVIHEVDKPKRLLNVRGEWEKETGRAYKSDAFIERTRMDLADAFAVVKRFHTAQAQEDNDEENS